MVATVVGGACSPNTSDEPPNAVDAKELAEQMITGELATTIGLGPLTAACNDPGPLVVGTTFACTATPATEPPRPVIQVQGVVNPDGHLALTTTNLISASALASFEKQAAAQLNDSIGSNFTAESVDCGNAALVLPADSVIGCALIMPASGQVFDVTLAVTDLNGRKFGLQVAEEPRA
jgi:hypothetical protein